MKQSPPPLPGTWQHTIAATGNLTLAVAKLLFGIMAELLYIVGCIALFCVAWPIMVPYLIIKHAVASGVRAGRGEE